MTGNIIRQVPQKNQVPQNFGGIKEGQNKPINPLHLQEWVEGSGVSPEIANLNIQSISSEDIFELLYPDPERNNPGRLTSEYLHYFEACSESSGWWIETIDPETGDPTGWGQFKADSGSPLANIAKYLTVKGKGSQPICLKVPRAITQKIADIKGLEYDGHQEFWQWFLGSKLLPVCITEGAKKSGSVLSLNIPSVGLTGIFNAFIKDGNEKKLHPTLAKICEGREVYILFDSDPLTKTKRDVRHAREKLGLLISKISPDVRMAYVPSKPGEKVGIDDYLVAGGSLTTVLKSAIPFKDWLNPKRSKSIKAQLQQMRTVLCGRLRYNEITNNVELDGEPTDPDSFKVEYADKIDDHNYSTERFKELVRGVARDRKYNPIQEYFDQLPITSYDLNEVAVKYFGVKPNSIECLMVRKWLISAVARTYSPGCQADSTLILYEPIGGVGKSTFFSTLCPKPEYFCNDMGDISNKDERLKMHQKFIIEWAELDGIFGFKKSSDIKSFLSCKTDNIRPPYDSANKEMKRRSIICGTSNKKDLLMETAGQRRYWIVEVHQSIDIELLKKERDAIWAAAKQAYLTGEQWWMSNEEQVQVNELLKGFKAALPLQDEIEEFIETLGDKDEFPTQKLRDWLGILGSDRKFSIQAKRVLEELGWEAAQKVRGANGTRSRGYKKKNSLEFDLPSPQEPVTDVSERKPIRYTSVHQSEQGFQPLVSDVSLNSKTIESDKNKESEVSIDTPDQVENGVSQNVENTRYIRDTPPKLPHSRVDGCVSEREAFCDIRYSSDCFVEGEDISWNGCKCKFLRYKSNELAIVEYQGEERDVLVSDLKKISDKQ